MSIQFEVEERPHYIYLSCTGVFGSQDFLDVCKEGISIAVDKKLTAILIDVRGLKGSISFMQRFELGKTIPEMQQKRSSPVCIAMVGDEPLIDPKRFGETVAVIRGVMGKVFTDIDEAVAWVEERCEKRQGC